MTQLAYNFPQPARTYPQFQLIKGGGNKVRGITKEVLILGGILAFLQILDGVLTSIGVQQWGIHAEGNLFLRNLMVCVGHLPALIIAKSVAIGVIGGLCYCSTRVKWISTAFRLVICIYLIAAIIPWTVLLFGKLTII